MQTNDHSPTCPHHRCRTTLRELFVQALTRPERIDSAAEGVRLALTAYLAHP